jgi:hypothetical protein
MADHQLPQEILVVTGTPESPDPRLEPRRGVTPRLPEVKGVEITKLQGQVNIFLQQLNVVMGETPESVGSFRLAEFEVSAGIVLEAGGGVNIALLANAQARGAVNASLKFVFKRS